MPHPSDSRSAVKPTGRVPESWLSYKNNALRRSSNSRSHDETPRSARAHADTIVSRSVLQSGKLGQVTR
jgi:hypothetical protein